MCSAADQRDAAQWRKLKPKVVRASTEVIEISSCASCPPETVQHVQELWGRSMVRYARALSCAYETTRIESQRAELVEELRRVFSGAMVAGAGDSMALLALMQKVELHSSSSLSEVLELYERLQDPTIRKAFVKRLKDLGATDSALGEKIAAIAPERADQDLLDVLLQAERASLAMGLSFVTERELRERRTRGVRGLQLVVQKDWAEGSSGELEASARDFIQAMKELLTSLTAEGIREEVQVHGVAGAEDAVCECTRDASCKAVLVVQLKQQQGRIQPGGEVRFREKIEERCAAPVAAPTKSQWVAGPAFGIDCTEGRSPNECANDRFKAASTLMNRLSYQFSMFGDIAFLTVDRRVDTIAPPFHRGVSITEMPIPVSDRAPDLLLRGLRIENHGCDKRLHDRVVQRLVRSYAPHIGDPIGRKGRALLEMTFDKPSSCTLRLRDVTGEVVYGFVVRFEEPNLASDAGEDSGRTVGHFYYNLHQAKLLAEKPRDMLPRGPRPSAASSFFVAGAPFLVDADSSNDAIGWLYAGVDTAGLVCGGVFTALSVRARNNSEMGGGAPFSAAQSYLGVAYACLGASLVSRVVSMMHYSTSP